MKLCTYLIFNIGECVYFKIERIDVKPIPTKLPIFENSQMEIGGPFKKEKLHNSGQYIMTNVIWL